MAVYKRGYQRYQGPLTGRWVRLLVTPRFAWQRIMQQRLVVIVMVVALFWPLACATFIYISNHQELWQGLDSDFARMLEIDGWFFFYFMNLQAVFAVILAAFAGPGLVAPDLANGGLPLYFSRPMSRTDYVISRMIVLAGLLSPVTWMPGMALFGMQWGMAGWSWAESNWQIGAAVLTGFLLWNLFVGLVALACAAYVKWRIIAGALVLGFFFVLTAAGEVINSVLRVDWGSLLSPVKAMNQIWRAMLGIDLIEGFETTESVALVAGMAGLLLVVLARKLRPVEVVS